MLKDKIKKLIKKEEPKKEEVRDTKDKSPLEYSHPEFDASVPANKQRHLR